MPKQQLSLRMIKDVLRLKWHAQLSHEQVAATLKISKGVVAKYVGLATAAGLDWDTVQDWSEQQLSTALQPRSAASLPIVVPDWGRIHRELDRKGVTLMLLWQEYVQTLEARLTKRGVELLLRGQRVASGLLCGQCGRRYAGDSTYLCGGAGDRRACEKVRCKIQKANGIR